MGSDRASQKEAASGAPLSTEAGVFSIERLTDDQWRAVRTLLERLTREADRAAPQAPPGADASAAPYLARIDRHRPNTILLIDGGRGSGKTSVLLTVLEILLTRLPAPARAGALDDAARAAGRTLPAPTNACIVPLSVVDLQALPNETHILLHVFGKLDTLIQSLNSGPGRGGAAAWATPSARAESPSLRERWSRLSKDATLGWAAQLPGQSGRIDPETYVLERGDAEQARLSLPDAFSAFVDALLGELKRAWQLDAPPLLLLPIDDADMNPQLSVALLQLLRLLYHPRLFFLVTGHSEQFLTMLSIDMLARLRRPLAGASLSDDAQHLHWTKAQALAEQWYSKAVPHHGRLALPGLSARERLSAFEGMLRDAGHFDALPGQRPGGEQSPLALAPLEPYRKQRPDLIDYLQAPAAVTEALPDHLRGLVALVQRVVSVKATRDGDTREMKAPSATHDGPAATDSRRREGQGGSDVDRTPAKEAILAMWDDARMRSELRDPKLTGVLAEALTGEREWRREATDGLTSAPATRLIVDGSGFSLNGRSAFWCPADLARPPAPTPTPPVGAAQEKQRFTRDDLRASFQLATAPRLVCGDVHLGPRLSGVLFLAAWVALEDPDDRVSGTTSRWEPYVAVDLPTEGRTARLRWHWPLPRWDWPDALLFTEGWFGLLRQKEYGAPLKIEDGATHFLQLLVRVALAPEPFDGTGTDLDHLATDLLRLRGHQQGQERQTRQPDDERLETHRRFVRKAALLFAAPEYGLPESWARAWVAALRAGLGPQAYAECVEATRRERQVRAARALTATQTLADEAVASASHKLLLDLDASFHSWEMLVRNVAVSAPASRGRRGRPRG